MGNSSKEVGNRLRDKLLSPLYIAIMLVGIIIIGNLFNWSDAVYGTHLIAFNPLLVILTIVLFAMYVYRVFRSA